MNTKEAVSKKLYENLISAKNYRLLAKNDKSLGEIKSQLKKFQIERLKVTHAEFLNSPNTAKATNFFLNELYSEKDLTKRDNDLEKILPMMEKLFPLNILEVVAQAIQLDALTECLDNKMATNLVLNFTEEQYLNTYKKKTSKEDRILQIKLTEALGNSLCNLINIPFLNTTLKIMKLPAKLASLQDMHQFLEEGFSTFKNTREPKKFVQKLIEKELELLEEIYAINQTKKLKV